MSDPFNRSAKPRDLCERIAVVKARVTFGEAARLLGLDHDLGVACPAPGCGALGLRPCHGGRGWRCEACGEKGDVIDLVRLARDCGPGKACDVLEREARAPRDGSSLELFR